MCKTKFIEIPVGDEFKTVNIQNIAMLEKDGIETIVILNITDDEGSFIKIRSIQDYNSMCRDISILCWNGNP